MPGKTSDCYIGHSLRLGKRVKEHAKTLESNTASFLEKLGDNAGVFLFVVTPEVKSKLNGLPLKEFLCVLEQYLFMYYFPAINRSQVATAGVLQSPQAVAKLRAKIGDVVHIYTGDKKDSSVPLVLVYSYPSAGFASTDLLGYERLGVRNILRRGGWYRDRLFFSKSLLPHAKENLMLLEDLKSLVNDIKRSPGPAVVEVLDTHTGEVLFFEAKNKAAAYLGCNREAIRKGRSNLYKQRYKITVLSDEAV